VPLSIVALQRPLWGSRPQLKMEAAAAAAVVVGVGVVVR